MQFNQTRLKDAFTIDLDKIGDDRGFFARVFCTNEFGKQGLDNNIVQINNSLSAQKGTLRGLHYQLAPHAESKLVRCIKGALYDVILDLREDSETFGQWFGEELTAENRRMMLVPKGFAHGFLTLTDDVEVFYCATEFYAQKAERGIRWNDPKFNIDWPIQPQVISEKDANWPDFNPDFHLRLSQ